MFQAVEQQVSGFRPEVRPGRTARPEWCAGRGSGVVGEGGEVGRGLALWITVRGLAFCGKK